MEKRGRKKRKEQDGFRVGKSDPLFRIFEKHLYEFNYETRESFITTVVREYIQHVSQNRQALIPNSRRQLLESTIADDVADMLVRKIYGCLEVVDDTPAVAKVAAKTTLEEAVEANVAAENAAAALTPQEIRKRLTKLAR